MRTRLFVLLNPNLHLAGSRYIQISFAVCMRHSQYIQYILYMLYVHLIYAALSPSVHIHLMVQSKSCVTNTKGTFKSKGTTSQDELSITAVPNLDHWNHFLCFFVDILYFTVEAYQPQQTDVLSSTCLCP